MHPLHAERFAPERMAELHHEAQRRRLIRSTLPPRAAQTWRGVVAARSDVTVVEFPQPTAAGVRKTHPALVGTLDHMLVGRRGISPVMIGRTTALTRLDRLVSRAVGEGGDDLPAVAVVAGEAGVGKTRLLQELVSSLPAGTPVLVGQAEPGSLGRPLDLVRAMLDESPTDLVDARAVAVDAVAARIGDGRALVVFEDLHWADSDSVGVFEQLAAMALPYLTLIATYRPDELTSRLPGGEMVVRLERRRDVHQVHLDRLDHHEVAAFLAAVYGRPLGTAVVDALRNRTGGNPFFLEEILVAAGDVVPEALAEQPLPWTLAELVSRQLDGLSAEQRGVIEAAAVLGSRAPFDVVAVLSNRSEEQLIADLRSLVAAWPARRRRRRQVQLPSRARPRRRRGSVARARTATAARAGTRGAAPVDGHGPRRSRPACGRCGSLRRDGRAGA